MRRILFCSWHLMLSKQRSIVPVLVTLTQSNLGKIEKNSQKKSLMSLININSGQNKRDRYIGIFPTCKKAHTFRFKFYCPCI